MINKHTIVGYLGADPELRSTGNEADVVTLSVATTEKWKDQSGEWKEDTQWHKCVAWNKLAKLISDFWQKGTLVYIEGRSATRKWQDQDGNDRYTTEITIREMKTLSGGKGRHNTQETQQQGGRSTGSAVPL
jgi:single-strand DNA-binding protein